MSNPKIVGGKPVIAGTRIPVDLILRRLAGELTVNEIAGEYPMLERDDILAALAYGAKIAAAASVAVPHESR